MRRSVRISSSIGALLLAWRSQVTAAAVFIALTMLPITAYAHGALQRSSPADGGQLSEAPRELRLAFTEEVEIALAQLVLTGPEGAVALSPLALAPDSATVLVAAIHGRLVSGTYRVEWQMTGADGHPVRGEYSFDIAPNATGLGTLVATNPPPQVDDPATAPNTAQPSDGSGSGATLWIILAGIVGVVGVVAFKLASSLGVTE